MRSGTGIRLAAVAVMLMGGGTLQLMAPGIASAQVRIGISVGFAPPELPVYAQPICPGDGYIWTPGYWAWDDDDQDYYWVPGTWVLAPEPGYLWTPGYWAWGGNAYFFHEGYWGPQIGFYGGINYGYGYFGRGYEGGRWDRGHFYYNRSVNNVNVTEIHNVYNTTIVTHNETRVSYNGGRGGINERANDREEAAARERHMGAIAAQNQQVQEARTNRELRASQNHGKPPIAATQRPGAFSGGGVVSAREGGNYNPPPNRGGGNSGVHNNERTNAENNAARPNGGNNNANRPNNEHRANNDNRPDNNANRPPIYVHPNELPPMNRSDRPPSTGNPKTDQKYQQQQDKMHQKQQQDHQKLQQKQDQEHQKMQQQQEQRHQQQTQQMEQKHTQQQQKMEQKQQPKQQQQSHPPQQSHQPQQQGEEKPHGNGKP